MKTRSISQQECVMLGSLTNHPELIHVFGDLEKHHFSSDYPYLCYEALKSADKDSLSDIGGFDVYLELQSKKRLLFDEMGFALDNFGYFADGLNGYTAEKAYNIIKNDQNFDNYKGEIVDILDDKSIYHIKEKLELINEATSTALEKVVEEEKMICVSDIKYKDSQKAVITYGLSEIDNKVVTEKNMLVIIAARPFNGKTSYALHVAISNTLKGKVIYYSMEMSKEQIARKLSGYGHAYNLDNLFVIERTTTTISQIMSTIKRHKPITVIIDQFNKIKGKGRTEYERFTNTARDLKICAGSMKTPIICLAQINRSATNERPMMHQIKGSGSLEEEADIVLLLHVDDREEKLGYVDIAKNRTITGILEVVYTKHNPSTNYYNFMEKGEVRRIKQEKKDAAEAERVRR